jgi:MFS superfamily sulfate permease-like transporter
VDGVRGFHDITRYPDARRVPGLVLFRWDAPLFFANAEQFHQRVLEAVAQSPTPVKRVLVAAEPVTGIDVTSGDMLAELEQALREAGIELRFAEMKDPVKDTLARFACLPASVRKVSSPPWAPPSTITWPRIRSPGRHERVTEALHGWPRPNRKGLRRSRRRPAVNRSGNIPPSSRHGPSSPAGCPGRGC